MQTIMDTNKDGKKEVILGVSDSSPQSHWALLVLSEAGTPIMRRVAFAANDVTVPSPGHPEQAVVIAPVGTENSSAVFVVGNMVTDQEFGGGDRTSLLGFNFGGNTLPGWPIWLYRGAAKLGRVSGNLALGNIIGDQKPEVVAADKGGSVWAYSLDGTLLPQWPRQLQIDLPVADGSYDVGSALASPTLVDLNGDRFPPITLQ